MFVHDRRTDKTTRVSVGRRGQATGDSAGGSISNDGRFVVFHSNAANLVRGDTNRSYDVFVRDRRRDTTRRVSVSTSGAQTSGGRGIVARAALDGSVSATGRYVAFSSGATNLVRGDTNDVDDVFVRDRVAKTTTRVSIPPNGGQFKFGNGSAGPSISADGNVVAFYTGWSDQGGSEFRSFVRDRAAGVTELLTPGEPAFDLPNSFSWSISAHGRYVTFGSNIPMAGEDPADEDFDGFVLDRRTDVTEWAALSSTGQRVWGADPVISADGQWIVFSSSDADVVPGDTNRKVDVFVRHR